MFFGGHDPVKDYYAARDKQQRAGSEQHVTHLVGLGPPVAASWAFAPSPKQQRLRLLLVEWHSSPRVEDFTEIGVFSTGTLHCHPRKKGRPVCAEKHNRRHEGGFYLHDAVQPGHGGARDAVTGQ